MRIESLIDPLAGNAQLLAPLCIGLSGETVEVASNSPAVLEALLNYLKGFIKSEQPGLPTKQLMIIEGSPPKLNIDLVDWPREAPKTARKEAYAVLSGGRVVKKIRTGLYFFTSEGRQLVVGACEENTNQIINFVGAIEMQHWLQRDYQLCHGAGVVVQGRGLGIFARSGGGKSTLALHLLSEGAKFCSNDRLLVKRSEALSEMRGIPKWPRVNPGTLLHNERLRPLLSRRRQQELERLTAQELWDLEEKYDVFVEELFGQGRTQLVSSLDALVILDWDQASSASTHFELTSIDERPDLLALITKNAGPLVGTAAPLTGPPNPDDYLPHLRGRPLLVASGKPDFPAAVQRCSRLAESIHV